MPPGQLTTEATARSSTSQPKTAPPKRYNLFNAHTVLALNNRYSVTGTNPWLHPSSILPALLFKFGMQIDF
jgi:hypothetical protein